MAKTTPLDFTHESLPKLIRTIAMPASVGFVFNTLYNVVDTYWGGEISTNALAALGLSFPVFFIILSIGMGLGTGTTALISNALGADNERLALKYTTQACSFALINSVLLTSLGFAMAPTLFRLMGASDEYLAIALRYMYVILSGTVFFVSNNILNAFLNARGDTKTYRNFLITGFVLNIALDPLFLYGFWIIPSMGIRGIALATVLIQVCGTIYLFLRVKKLGLFDGASFRLFVPHRKPFLELFRQGFPASLNMMTIALGIFIITFFAGKYGKEAVAAYGVSTRIEQLALLPTIGLTIASLTITGQNFGAKRMDRVEVCWKLNLKYGCIIMLVGSVLVYAFCPWLLQIFSDDAKVNQIAVEYLRIATLFFVAYIPLNVSISTLQGLKFPMYAIWIGLYRQILLPIPLFYVLSHCFSMEEKGIWWGILVSTVSASLFTLYYTSQTIQRLREREGELMENS